MIADVINRKLTLNSVFSGLVDKMKGIPDITKAIKAQDKKASRVIESIKQEIEKGQFPIHSNTEPMFKELFAHDRCYILMNGMYDVLCGDHSLNARCMVAQNGEGTPLHWLVAFDHQGKEYYADAYGIFDNVEDIISRYENSDIEVVNDFEIYDEDDPLYETFVDLMIDSQDEVFDFALTHFDEDMPMDEQIEFHTFMMSQQALTVFDLSPSLELTLEK